jgi:hypothetical protein
MAPPQSVEGAHVEWGIEEIARWVRKPRCHCNYKRFENPPLSWAPEARAVSLRRMIRQRRSAVAMDGRTRISSITFYRMLDRTLAVPEGVPFSILPRESHIHLALMVHCMDDLPRGLYLLVRDAGQTQALQQAITQADPLQKPPGCPHKRVATSLKILGLPSRQNRLANATANVPRPPCVRRAIPLPVGPRDRTAPSMAGRR